MSYAQKKREKKSKLGQGLLSSPKQKITKQRSLYISWLEGKHKKKIFEQFGLAVAIVSPSGLAQNEQIKNLSSLLEEKEADHMFSILNFSGNFPKDWLLSFLSWSAYETWKTLGT